jgi:hypothetical protein
VLLADDVGELLRAILTGQDLIAHEEFLIIQGREQSLGPTKRLYFRPKNRAWSLRRVARRGRLLHWVDAGRILLAGNPAGSKQGEIHAIAIEHTNRGRSTGSRW